MSKIKKGTIFKICVISLIIILSTVGLVWSAIKSQNIELDESAPSAYKAQLLLTNKTEVTEGLLAFSNELGSLGDYKSTDNFDWLSKLKAFKDVLCCQRGTRLPTGSYVVESALINGSPAQSYILAHIPKSVEAGQDWKYSNDIVQTAWWNLIDRLGVKGRFLEFLKDGKEFNVSIKNPQKPIENEIEIDKTELYKDLMITDEELLNIINKFKNDFNKDSNNDYKQLFIDSIDAFADIDVFFYSQDFQNNGNISLLETKKTIQNYYKFIELASKDSSINQNDIGEEQYYIDYFSAGKDVNGEWNDNHTLGWYNNWIKRINTDRVNEIFGQDTNLDYYRRPVAYESMYKFSKEEIKEFLDYIMEYIESKNYEDYVDYDPSFDIEYAKSLVDEAEKYEEFYQLLKDNPKISLDTTYMQVQKSDELNAFVVGPLVAEYTQGGVISVDDGAYRQFGGMTGFIINTDKKELNNQVTFNNNNKIDDKGRIKTSLDNTQFALTGCEKDSNTGNIIGSTYKLCGTAEYPYPASGEQFYIVFNAGDGDEQITNIGYKYDYLCHNSTYAYYKLNYQASEDSLEMDAQDLAEVNLAELWYNQTEVNLEIPITRTISLKKEVPGDYPITDPFYFDIYEECKGDNCDRHINHDSTLNVDGVTYAKVTETTVSANGTPTKVEGLSAYYQSELESGGVPKVIAVEKDEKGRYFFYDGWKKDPDSLWHKYTPEGENGVFKCEENNVVIEDGYELDNEGNVIAINYPNMENYHLEIDKKMTENRDNDTFFAKLDLTIDKNTKTYIIPIQPSGEAQSYNIYSSNTTDERGYYICYIEKEIPENTEVFAFGSIETGSWDNYIHAKWTYDFKLPSKTIVNYTVTEVDENYSSYDAQGVGSVWNKYEKPEYENRTGVMQEDRNAQVIITNKQKPDDMHIELNLSKQVQDKFENQIESDKEFAFDIFIKEKKEDNTENELVAETKFVPVTCPNEEIKEVKFTYDIYNINKSSTYTIEIKEKLNSGYVWKDIIEDLEAEDWTIERDEDGYIEKIYYTLNNDMKEFTSSFTNINYNNQKHNSFKITKIFKDEEGNDLTEEEINKYFKEHPEGFTFMVSTTRGHKLQLDDFNEPLWEKFVDARDEKIYITINKDNYKNGVESNEIYWNDNESAPVYEVYEIDKDGNSYLQYIELGQNRPENSIWNMWIPKDGGHYTIDFFTQDSEQIVIEHINTLSTFDKQLTITKEVIGPWDNNDEFYFRILSVDGTATNIVEQYFNKEDLTTLGNGLRVVKVTKEEQKVSSKVLTYNSIDELPQFWVTEVDQHGEPWSNTPSNEDSLWNHYTPEGYGTWTCQFIPSSGSVNLDITAKNYSRQIILGKEIVTNGEYTTDKFFEDFPNAEFYFRLFDSKGNVVTKDYFDTKQIETYNAGTVDAIVINKDNYTGIDSESNRIESLPIAESAGDRFILQEVFKSKEDENLYGNELKSWTIDFEQSENNIVEFTVENIAEKTLTIDKVIEGAPDEFLPEEVFYFKVFENDNDVTNDLFGTDIVTIDETAHKNGGISSRVVYGKHTYKVIEYDAEENGRTYLEGKDSSEFWKKFIPTNNGIWTISLESEEGPAFVKAINYRNTTLKIEKEIFGNCSDEDKNQTFDVTILITPQPGSWVNIDGELYSEPHLITKQISVNSPAEINDIYWELDKAPIYQVSEKLDTMPNKWTLAGYRIGEDFYPYSVPKELIGGENNTVVVQNEKSEDNKGKIAVVKSIIDQNGIQTILDEDTTFYFDIYVAGEGVKYDTMSVEETNAPAKLEDAKEPLTTLEVNVVKGSSQTVFTKYIDYTSNKLDYKVVEVDQFGKSYGEFMKGKTSYDNEEDYKNSLWNKFDPAISPNGKEGNKEGIWTGSLTKDNPTSEDAKIYAYNKVTKVTIDFEKWVWFAGKLQPIEPGKTFKFIAEYTSSIGRELDTENIEITSDNLYYSKTFELLKDEKITYKITEVDQFEKTYEEFDKGVASYDSEADYKDSLWNEFTPYENNGIIEGTVDDSSANMKLIGKNIKNVHGWLAVTKELSSEWLENEKFYFEVFENDENVTEELFNVEQVELTYDDRVKFSNEVIWKSGTSAPTYTVKEVGYDDGKYTPVEEEKTVTIKEISIEEALTEENFATVTTFVGFENIKISERFKISKTVYNQEGEPTSYSGNFYAIVLDKDGNNVTEELFEVNDDGLVELSYNKEAVSKTIYMKKEETLKYTVVEVDKFGNTFEQGSNNAESIWNQGFKPRNDTGKYDIQLLGQNSETEMIESVVNIKNDSGDIPEPYTLTKVIKTVDENGNEIIITDAVFEEGEHFYFKVTDSNGNDAIDTLFKDIITNDENEKFKLIDLFKEQQSVKTIDIYSNMKEKYTITETDQYGVPFGEYKKPAEEPENGWSVWEEYKPSDGIGIWYLDESQTAIVADNIKIKYDAEIKLSKQTTDNWDDGVTYKFNIYIKDAQSKEDPKPIEVVLDNKHTTWNTNISWNKKDGAPSIRVDEIEAEGVTLEMSIGENKLIPGDYYTLKNEDGVLYTIDAINHIEDKEAHFEIYKKALNQKEIYKFEYQYGRYNEEGNWIAITDVKELNVIPNEIAISDTKKWNPSEEATPMFRIWETSGKLESITATNAGNTTEIEVDGKYKGIEGTLNPTTAVKVFAENEAEHKGKIKVIKTFDVGKDDLLTDLYWLAKEYIRAELGEQKFKEVETLPVDELYNQYKYIVNNIKFTFNLSISYEDKDSKFFVKVNDENGENVKKEFNTWNVKEEWTLARFIDALAEDHSDNTVTIIPEIEVEWSGSAPKYSVDEIIYTNSFWNPERKNNCSGKLVCTDCSKDTEYETACIEAEIINRFDKIEKHKYVLLTSLAGHVWIETPENGKTINIDGIMNVDKYNPLADKYASDVYVIPYRCIVDTNGNIIDETIIGEDENVIYKTRLSSSECKNILKKDIFSSDIDYKYISKDDDGHWEFSNVKVPAFDLNNEIERKYYKDGCLVKYYVDFYYDGIKYEPTTALVEGDANDYLQLNEGYNKYFDNSCAIEDETYRKDEYNSRFATVQGKELYKDGTSKGEFLDSEGKANVDIDYTTQIEGTIDGSKIIRATTDGVVNMPINESSSIDEIQKYYMKASTETLGLKYLFKNIALGDIDWQLIDVIRNLEDDNGQEKMVYNYKYKTEFVSADYAQHINLGLVEREQIDVSIDKKIESVTIVINEKALTYNFNNDGKFEENLQNAISRFTRTIDEDDEIYSMLKNDYFEKDNRFNIYTSDYYYRSDVYEGTNVKEAYDSFMNALVNQPGDTNAIKTKELQMFLTYSVTLINHSNIYDVEINSLVDYYDSSLTYVDVHAGYAVYQSSENNGIENLKERFVDENGESYYKEGLYAYVKQDGKEHSELTNIFGNEYKKKYYENAFESDKITSKEEVINANYKKMVIEDNIKIDTNTFKTYYLTYRADKADDLENGIILGTKNNIAEITSFTPYMKGTNDYAAVIDKDSAPGNYNIYDEISMNVMEDDTDFANVSFSTKPPPEGNNIRSISGTAWLDNENGTEFEGQILGDSIKKDNDYLISGLTTKLVEVIDLPVVENGEIKENYIEYEFYWDGAETTTNEYGTYKIDSYISESGVIREGLVAGNYVVRFFYGDKDTDVYKNGDKITLETQINGEDYKTTAYQIGKHNDGYINNEWHDLFNGEANDNDARDNEARRLEIIRKTQELNNSNTKIFDVANYENAEKYAEAKTTEYLTTIGEIIPEDISKHSKYSEFVDDYKEYKAKLYGEISYENGATAYNGIIDSDDYKMFADTAKLNLKVEYGKDIIENAYAEAKAKGLDYKETDLYLANVINEFNNNSVDLDLIRTIYHVQDNEGNEIDKIEYKYQIENINLGLEERSKTNIYLDKQIKEITLTTSSDKKFFHVEYDISYTAEDMSKDPDWNKVADNLYVKLEVDKSTLFGENNLQTLDDKLDENAITQGFRYINIDSTVLQGLKLDIKYEITAINLSETDKYGKAFDEKSIEAAIEEVQSPCYVIDENKEALLFEDYDGDGKVESAKAYGRYLGHTYYQGFGATDIAEDKVVKTTVRKVIDYIDNDIEANVLELNENGSMWNKVENSKESLSNSIDKHIFNENGVVLDTEENPYKTIMISADSKEANGEFVKELLPLVSLNTEIEGNVKDSEGKEIKDKEKNKISAKPLVTATIAISTSKVFAGTDEGRTSMDNLAEILMIENTVGRRDMSTVYGNYNPMGGFEQTTERDETATEIVTLSPPTGNFENERNMTNYIIALFGVAILAGAGVGIKLKISGKRKKSEKTEE